MSLRTKKIIALSFLLLLSALGAVGFLTYQIDKVGNLLVEQTNALNEKTAKQSAFLTIERLTQTSAEDRATLASAFFANESDSITFLGDIETFARSINVALETQGLDIVTSETGEKSMIMTFLYSGTRQQVLTFTKMLEEIPYHSKIESLNFSEKSGSTWEGSMTILISIASTWLIKNLSKK